MVAQINLSIHTAREEDRQKLANLIHFEALVHRHLDWKPPLDWIGHEPYLVAAQDRDLLAALACPEDPAGVAWIRLFAVSSEINAEKAWSALWSAARSRLSDRDDVVVAAIPLQDWFTRLLQASGFVQTTDVMILLWRGTELPACEEKLQITLRPMNIDDLEHVEQLDTKAFGKLWRNSHNSLELAYRQAAIATVAEKEQRIIAYQISTANHLGGHLARLAVHPDSHGQGVGYAVLHDMLKRFERRGAKHISVNTQSDNIASLALYKKAGFESTGETYPVYQYTLS